LPGSIHAKIIIKLFRANKNIICEKPFTIKYSDAQKILKEQKKSKKIALVNFCYNFLEPIKVIQNEIYKNKINLHTVNVYWQSYRDEKNKKNWKNYINHIF
jgi:predicted dehydrogenase